jgi:hypothetical protein
VRPVSAAATVRALTFHVSRSTSANVGVAPRYAPQFALAANVSALVSSSSPRPAPAANAAACRPAVPEEKATA